jgi:hypothetical protein
LVTVNGEDSGQFNLNVDGYGQDNGAAITGLSFADVEGNDLNVNLQLTTTDASFDGVDGTVTLNTSLAALAGMGIDTVQAEAESGVGTVNLVGYGQDNGSAITGLSFADVEGNDLNVNLQLTTTDDGFDGVDGTVTLNTSLAALAGMGIDTVEAAAESGVGTVNLVGYGQDNDSAITGLSFADSVGNDLNVNLQLTTTDASFDGGADGTVTLNTSLAELENMGIDFIEGLSGVNSVILAGGIGDIELDDIEVEDIEKIFHDDLIVKLDMDDDAVNNLIGNDEGLTKLQNMGIDFIGSTNNYSSIDELFNPT